MNAAAFRGGFVLGLFIGPYVLTLWWLAGCVERACATVRRNRRDGSDGAP